jgi:tetratricopeptide (TPR) repeat protein
MGVMILQTGRRSAGAIGSVFRRFPYIGIAILIVGLAGAGYSVYQRQQQDRWRNATDAYRRADYKAAYQSLKGQALPGQPEKLRVYAQTMLATGHLPEALAGYKKLYSQTKDPQAKIVIGNIYNEQHKYDEAITVYQELISSNPNFTQAYVNLATVRRLQGSPKEALEVAKAGLADNPSNVILCELVVSLSMDDKQSSDYQTAVATLKKLNPNDPLLEMLKVTPKL